MELHALTLEEVMTGLKTQDFSSEEITKAYLTRIKKTDGSLKSFLELTEEKALKDAKTVDTKRSQGDDLPLLAGVPYSIKDNFNTTGFHTTASSNILRDYVSPFDATVYKHLEENQAILLGKTNMDSFAHGSSTETSDFFTTSNPWDIDRLPGGSSGGAASSVAANQCVFGIGSETAGSIRLPASWCGVTGLKPTYGRVSRYGVVAMGSSLDSPGPLAKSVIDAAYVYEAIAGHDPQDATTSKMSVGNVVKNLEKPIAGLTIGIADSYFEGADPEIISRVQEGIKVFENLGAKVKKVDLFDPQYAIAVYTIIQRSEVSSNLARYDEIRTGRDRTNFNQENIRRIMLGTYVLSAGYYDAYYLKGQKVRTLILEDFAEKFKDVDVIIGPTTPVTSLKKGASEESAMFGELMDVLLEPSSISGLPGLSVPCGFSNGLPVGMQIIGPQFSEELILRFGYHYQKETDWHKKRPTLKV